MKILYFALVGIISGIITVFVTAERGIAFFGPGIVYGLAMALALFAVGTKKYPMVIVSPVLLLVGSCVVWYIARMTADAYDNPIIPGAVGGLLFCFVAWLVYRNIPLYFTFLGAIVGALTVGVSTQFDSDKTIFFLFASWQAGIAMVIASGILVKEKQAATHLVTQSPN